MKFLCVPITVFIFLSNCLPAVPATALNVELLSALVCSIGLDLGGSGVPGGVQIWARFGRIWSPGAPNCSLEGSRTHLGVSWALTGLLECSWRPLGTPLEASWVALGGLRGGKQMHWNGSWPLQDEFQDSFQPSWGPKAPKRDAKRLPNRAREAT